MKHSIEGFSQKYALQFKKEVPDKKNGTKIIKLDFTDLVILRWFVDFYPNMIKMEVNGRQYARLSHNKMLEDLPLLDISRKAAIDRMKKLVEFGILDYEIIKDGGTFSLYTFGKNYIGFVDDKNNNSNVDEITKGSMSTIHPGVGQPSTGVVGQPSNKDKSIINKSIINNNIVEQSSNLSAIKEIVDYLNLKAGTNYRYTTKDTQKHIRARLNEGFTVEDFKTVIDNQCSKWLGDNKMQGYLRPETLFGTKFESYLNSKPKGSSNNGTEGQECEYDYIGTIL